MKFQATFIATCLAFIATADGVAGWWIVDPATYNLYCGDKPTRDDSFHVCFTASATLIKKIPTYDSFEAYLSPDLRGFVLVPPFSRTEAQGSEILTDTYGMIVNFNPGKDQTSEEGKKCADIVFEPLDGSPIKTKRICQPGGGPVKMPEKFPWPSND
ncbi:uncharacterized protein UTRI_10012 [Ustilago trichophora]|uniref:Mig1 protein n=1 Tax=Ustilago trichophora TaxID=86804 RepID=A0A5C3DQT8_9BASI|nr:uncharacterized protein UTRI_10012 [Ustilago trichophora]